MDTKLKKLEVVYETNDEGTLKAFFSWWLPSHPTRKNNKVLSIFQRYKKNKIDPRKIEAFINYLIYKKVITPEFLQHETMAHVKLLVMKNMRLIEKEGSNGRQREIFREFIDGYKEKGVDAFKMEMHPKDKFNSTESTIKDLADNANPFQSVNDISVWPKGGLLGVDPENKQTGRSVLFLGASFSGKTYLLVKELNKIYPDEYDGIFLFTESTNAEDLQRIKPQIRERVRIFKGWKPTVVDFLKKLNDKLQNRFRFLIILDDIVTEKFSKTLSKMILTYRNANISCCVLIQFPSLINKSSRSSFHNVVILGGKSLEWHDSVAKIFDLKIWAKNTFGDVHRKVKYSNEEILQMLKMATNEPQNVIFIDLRKGKEPLLYKT